MNKGKVFTIIIVILMASIAVGYTATGCILRNENKDGNVLTSSENSINSKYNKILSKLNFTNSFSSSDGKDENNITTGGINDINIFVRTNNHYYEFNCIEKPVSVRVEYNENEEYNYLYVLNSVGDVYKFKDTDLIKVIDNDYCTIIKKINISNILNIATTDENISLLEKYPALYVKRNDGKIYVSEFDKDFVELKELVKKSNK